MKGDSLSRRSHDPEEQQQKIYHLGCQPSNLPGLVNSSTVYPDEDGTQVVFGVDSCLAATRLSIMPTGRKNQKLFRSEDVLQGMVQFITSRKADAEQLKSVGILSVHIGKYDRTPSLTPGCSQPQSKNQS